MWRGVSLTFLPLVEEIISCGTPRGMDAHPAAADRAKDCSAGEPVSFLPWLQNQSPKGPFVSVLNCLCLCLFYVLKTFWSIANSFFPLLINLLVTFHRSPWQCSCVLQHPCLPRHFSEVVSSLLADFYTLCLPPIPVWFHAHLSPKKEKPATVEDLKSGMSLTWLSCLLVKPE